MFGCACLCEPPGDTWVAIQGVANKCFELIVCLRLQKSIGRRPDRGGRRPLASWRVATVWVCLLSGCDRG